MRLFVPRRWWKDLKKKAKRMSCSVAIYIKAIIASDLYGDHDEW